MGCTGTSRFLIDLKIGKSSIKMTETVSAKWIFHCQPKLPRRSCDAQAQAMDRPVVRLTAMAMKGWCSKLIMTLIVNDVNDSVYLIESGWIMCVSLLYFATCCCDILHALKNNWGLSFGFSKNFPPLFWGGVAHLFVKLARTWQQTCQQSAKVKTFVFPSNQEIVRSWSPKCKPHARGLLLVCGSYLPLFQFSSLFMVEVCMCWCIVLFVA